MRKTNKQITPGISFARRVLVICALAVSGLLLSSCGDRTGREDGTITSDRDAVSYAGDSVYTIVNRQPEFPGGNPERVSYLREHLRYPDEALQQGIQGTVFASFVVRHDGRITNVEIVRGVDPELDNEVIRVLGLMPDWQPGMLEDGTPVSVMFHMPVRFVADDQPLSARIPRGRDGEVLVVIGEEVFIRESGQRTRFDDLIDPDQIESMTILTDEDAMEAYGYQTVILITRKQ